MRVLHVASSYPLSPGDSTAPFMEEMLRALVQRGTDVSIVVPRVAGLEDGVRGGISVVSSPYAPTRFQTWGYGRSLDQGGRISRSAVVLTPIAISSMTRVVRRELRRNAPDVIHFHWVLPNGMIALALPHDVPVVISVHGADVRFLGGRLRPLTRRILARADALVAASSKILDTVSDLYPDAAAKSVVIPHGADSELFKQGERSAARMALGIPEDRRVVLGIGRLVRKKGFDLLVDAMDSISDPSVELFIVGDGPERPRLAAMSAGDRVHLPGRASRSQVATWMAAADVVAIPSVEVAGDVDSGPVVMMEALASGRAVVATPIGMAPDVVDHGVNGYLLESLDPVHVASMLTLAIENSAALGAAAADTFDAIGDWSRVAVELGQIYESAISSRIEAIGAR